MVGAALQVEQRIMAAVNIGPGVECVGSRVVALVHIGHRV